MIGPNTPTVPEALGPKKIDFTAGYRDSTKGATLKALQQRRADIQGKVEAAMKTRDIDSMWQGGAQLAEVIGGSIREGRAANQEAAGRARYAELLAGGLAPDEIGEAMGLDPETTQKYQDQTWKREDDLTKHGWDVDAATERARVELERQKAGFAHDETLETGRQTFESGRDKTRREFDASQNEDQQKEERDAEALETENEIKKAKQDAVLRTKQGEYAAAVEAGTMTQQEADDLIEQDRRLTESEIEQNKPTTFGPMTPEVGAKWNIPEAQWNKYKVNSKTGEPELISKAPGGSNKDIYNSRDKVATLDTSMDDLQRALELNDKVTPGPIGKGLSDAAGWLPEGWVEGIGGKDVKGELDATKEFYQLMSAGAMTRMAEQLKGSTAYQEVMHYQEIFASPTSNATVRRNALEGMMNAIRKHRAVIESRLRDYGEEVAPYVQTKRGGDTAAPAEAPAAAPAADNDPAPDPATATVAEIQAWRKRQRGR